MEPESDSGSLTSGAGPAMKSMATSGGSSGSRIVRNAATSVRPLPAVKDNVKRVMFYC